MSTILPQGALGIAEDEFWDYPLPTFEVKRELLSQQIHAIILDGPTTAKLNERDTLVYAVCNATTISDDQRFGFKQRSVLITTRLEDCSVDVGWGFEAARLSDPIAPLPSDPDEAPVVMAFNIDLRRQLPAISWQRGTLRSWLLLFDQRSNSVTTQLIKQQIADQEVSKYLDAMRSPAWASPPSPSAGRRLPSYKALTGSPPVPAEPGVSIAIERVIMGSAEAQVVCQGSFRLPALKRDLVKTRAMVEAEALQIRNKQSSVAETPDPFNEPRPSAVVPITILAIGDSKSSTDSITLRVPSYDAVNLEADDGANIVTGHFAFDMRTLLDMSTYQSYAVWVIADGELSGPTLTALVDPTMIPKPGE
ncbi:MAG: hypothetical protein ACI8O8_000045 [Oleiphilaceae bacterium]|jgi:hypothetical protein